MSKNYKLKEKKFLSETWCFVNSNSLFDLAVSDLNTSSLKVFLYMVSKLDYGNKILLDQKKCSKDLGITKATVSNSLYFLEDFGAIKKSPEGEGNMNYYQVNPTLIYRGKNSDFQDCCDSYLDLV